MSKSKEHYAALLKEAEKQHLTIRQLALKAGIIPQNLYNAINGNMRFWPGWRSKVATALGVNEEELFEGVDDDE